MSQFHDSPDVLIERAAEDQYAVEHLADDPAAAETIVGFHAQQAVEKSIKAVLASRAVPYGRTHDLAGLVDRLRKGGIPDPPDVERLPGLTFYAVESRYAELPPEPRTPRALDRQWAKECVAGVLAWARAAMAQPPPSE
jgi:HEPN domain-containing protein